MTPYERLLSQINAAAAELKSSRNTNPIRLIGHLDADGISASAILVKALLRLGRSYQLYIISQLDSETLRLIDEQGDGMLVCADVGSGQFTLLRQMVRSTRAIVLDHHELDDAQTADNIAHINPHLFGIPDSKEISGAGLSYLFAEALDPDNKDLAHLAVIGAIGDGQQFLTPLNKRILETAKRAGTIIETQGLKLFGRSTRPLHKVLEYSTDYTILGVTGSENGSLAFLESLGIPVRDGEKYRTLADLDVEEYQKLVAGIIMRRAKHKNPLAIIGPTYSLASEPPTSQLHDAREFCTLLNACGRMDKSSLGVGVCLGDENLKKKALLHVARYKRHLLEIMRWYESAHDEVRREKGALIINAQDAVEPTLIGTLCSIVSRSGKLEEGTVVIGLSRLPGKKTKVSMRAKGHDLFKLATTAAEKVGGQAGGHKEAAGAIIPTLREEDFIHYALERIKKTKK